jgi:hypothetical protein
LNLISEGTQEREHSSFLIFVTIFHELQYNSFALSEFAHSFTGSSHDLYSGRNDENCSNVTVFLAAGGVLSVTIQLQRASTSIVPKLLSYSVGVFIKSDLTENSSELFSGLINFQEILDIFIDFTLLGFFHVSVGNPL